MTKVMKFGGGCLKDADTLARAAAIVCAEGRPPAVVVSAVFGVTDLLLAGLAEAKRDEGSIPASIQALRELHAALVRGTIGDERRRETILHGLEARLKKVERLLHGVAYTGEISPTVRPRVLSFGERLGALLFAGALADRGVRSLPLESEQAG